MLIKKIHEQVLLAQGQEKCETVTLFRLKKIRNFETALTKTIEVLKRIRAWRWTGDNGKLCLNVKYGANTLELSKGKYAIELSSADELIRTLNLVKDAVEFGELDSQIKTAAGIIKSGFKH
jgi:hypothetical protein